MNTFFIEFRDPLFGIIVFFALVFVITFFSYWWGRYKSKEDSKDVDKFLKQFQPKKLDDSLSAAVASSDLSSQIWIHLAGSYAQSGAYEKSIEIYTALVKKGESTQTKELLLTLGKTYYRAGFLERAKQVFLEILKNNPRTPEALRYLFLIYEQMREYAKAKEVLEPLEAMEIDISLDASYIEALELINDFSKEESEKVEALLVIHKQSHRLSYMIFAYIFQKDPKTAWDNFDASRSKTLSDILWTLPKSALNMNIIENNGFLKELYSARGDVQLAKSSAHFELDLLIQLQQKADATLSFEYVCTHCKTVYPFAFYRCSHCHKIDMQRVDCKVVKDYYKDISEENNSFQ